MFDEKGQQNRVTKTILTSDCHKNRRISRWLPVKKAQRIHYCQRDRACFTIELVYVMKRKEKIDTRLLAQLVTCQNRLEID